MFIDLRESKKHRCERETHRCLLHAPYWGLNPATLAGDVPVDHLVKVASVRFLPL